MNRSVDFPEDMLKRIKALAEKKAVTVSAIIKMACAEYLDREEKKLGK